MTEKKRTRYRAVRGLWYPKTAAGFELAEANADVRPGDPRIVWARVEAGETFAPPYSAVVGSLLRNKLVEEVN